MTLITAFTAPKPFTNPHIATIQRNAIQSWIHLGSEVEVLLMGDEEGMAEDIDTGDSTVGENTEVGTPNGILVYGIL